MRVRRSASDSDRPRRLLSLDVGAEGVVIDLHTDRDERAERLTAMGVTPGARVRVLQRFPGFVFECDETELAVEPAVAREILVGDVRPGARPHGRRRGFSWPTMW